jgi:hypothetical protein
MRKEWVVSVREQCQAASVKFFFKQWGGVRKVKNGRQLDGRTYDEYPKRFVAPVPDRLSCADFAESVLQPFRSPMFKSSLVQVTA